jgi:ESS family glutamate:Na+ symporter
MSAWAWLVQFFIIATALLVANVIRVKFKFMSRSLIPTALIAGLLILLLKLIPGFNNFINKPSMEIMTYHALGLGFVALALKNNKIESRSSTMKVTETGAVTAATYVIQGIIGLAITIPLFLWWNSKDFFYTSGLLLPMGFGQGPGQALNFGKIYEGWAMQGGRGFSGADFGLSIAAIGFLVGSIIGVIYMNYLRRKGKLKAQNTAAKEVYTLKDYESENEIPNTESVDKLSIQVCLVLFVYFLVFLLMYGIENANLGDFGTKTLKPLVWGFNFLWGTLFGVLVKNVLNLFKKVKFMQREYINNYMLNRISGCCFDIMIVAGTAAISFENLRNIWLPLIIVCTLGAIGTFWFVRKCTKHLYPTYEYEGFFSMFGMLTGTASNGMILLREIDPKFETPASNNLVLQTIPAIVFGFPILLLMGFAPQSMHNTWLTLFILIGIELMFCLFIFRTKIFKKRKLD